uniref:Uncharacterized protein n=1 Tax=Chelonoidis abingdonii TaxID=106734 RepID=A0A8C0GLX8_CHEAB
MGLGLPRNKGAPAASKWRDHRTQSTKELLEMRKNTKQSHTGMGVSSKIKNQGTRSRHQTENPRQCPLLSKGVSGVSRHHTEELCLEKQSKERLEIDPTGSERLPPRFLLLV